MNKATHALAVLMVLLIVLSTRASAQILRKPWEEWSKNDAEKILSDSPWAQTKVETNVSEMFYSPTADSRISRNAPNAGVRLEEGATNQEIRLRYHIRFYSARPVRQALARLFELRQKLDRQTKDNLHDFAELKAGSSIIVTVTFESDDQRFSNRVMQAFNSAVTGTLKNKTYLERKDGSRLFLEEYVPPGKDGFGARFIFLRFVNERPYIDQDTGEVRFVAEYGENLKINARFKTSEMIYKGALEY